MLSPLYHLKIFLLIHFIALFSAGIKAQDDSSQIMIPVGKKAFEVMSQFFDYDKVVPLDLKIIERIDYPEYIREKFVFQGTRYSSVPGYIAIPKKDSASHPCILLLHGLNSSKESWWEENSKMKKLTLQLLDSGFAVISLDAEYHGERIGNNELESPVELLKKGWFVRSRDMMIQTVIEYRRAIDYLAARDDIDTSRVGIIGYSMGGIMTFILSAVESRIKVSVSCVSPVITVPYLPTGVYNFAPYIKHQPFLMLMANNDEQNYSVEAAKQLYNLIGSIKKDLIFFDSGHMLPAEWIIHAAEWMNDLK